MFSDKICFCLSVSDSRILVSRRPSERLERSCIRRRHTGPTPGVLVWKVISYDSRSSLIDIPITLIANSYVRLVIELVVLPFLITIPRGMFQQDSALPHTATVTQRALKNVDMMPWSTRSQELSSMEHVWGIIGRQIQRHPQITLIVADLINQV